MKGKQTPVQPRIIRQDIIGSAIRIRKRRVQIRQIWENILVRLLILVLMVWGVFSFVLGVQTVKGNDMFPAVRDGDLAIFLRLADYQSGDVVLYGDAAGRILATGGTKIDKTGSDLITIDGNIQPVQARSGLFYETKVSRQDLLDYPSIVPRDSYLVLGDNRESARDSRALGYVPGKKLKGKVFMVVKRRAI